MFSRSVFRRKLTRILRVTKVAFEGATQRFDVDIGRIPGRGWNYNFHMSNIARWSIVINETLRLLNALTCRIFADELKGELRTPVFEGQTDFLVFLLLSLGLFVINWGLRLAIVEPLAALLLGSRSTRSRVQKFAQSSLEMIFYGAFSVFGASVVPKQEWFWPSKLWWSEFITGESLFMTDELKLYYLLYAARYCQGAVSVFIEHKRKDFWEMQVHHFVTVSLIGVSYAYGWNRVGAVVMVLLDPADVPLHIAKQFKYIGDARGGNTQKLMQAGADFFFVVFMLLFGIMRLGLYPYVVWSAHIEARRYFVYGYGAWTCVALLYVLLMLQLYWFALILKVAIKVITSGTAEDVRSDDEDEDRNKIPKKNN